MRFAAAAASEREIAALWRRAGRLQQIVDGRRCLGIEAGAEAKARQFARRPAQEATHRGIGENYAACGVESRGGAFNGIGKCAEKLRIGGKCGRLLLSGSAGARRFDSAVGTPSLFGIRQLPAKLCDGAILIHGNCRHSPLPIVRLAKVQCAAKTFARSSIGRTNR
jgi:hypothetical protein